MLGFYLDECRVRGECASPCTVHAVCAEPQHPSALSLDPGSDPARAAKRNRCQIFDSQFPGYREGVCHIE